MRIDAIAIENLASLLGRQTVIDLRPGRSPVGGAGLIAITGPTGAGKSTILDAVCLAIFGQTPRQTHKHHDPGTLLSRAAAEGQVQVDLTLDDGTPWRLQWSIRRARGRLDGVLQTPVRRISDPATGQVLVEGASEVDALVQRHLRLTVEQFRTVVMLAQGDFAAFLKAKDSERAALLELLTGSDIYTRLGIAAYERWRTLEQDCASGDAALAQIMVLEPDARRADEAALAALVHREIQARADQEARRADHQAVERWTKAVAGMATAESAAAAAGAAVAAIAGDRDRLSLAELSRSILPVLRAAEDARRRRQQRDQERLQGELVRTDLDQRAGQGIAQAGTAIALAQAATIASVAQAAARAPWAAVTVTEVQGLKTQLLAATHGWQRQMETEAAVRAAESALATAQSAADAAIVACANAATLEASAESAVTAATARITDLIAGRTRDDLIDHAHLLSRALDQRQARWPDPEAAAERLRRAEVALVQRQQIFSTTEVVLGTAQAAVTAQENQVERAVVMARLGDFSSLLLPGEPCPLCGSSEHPAPHLGGDALVAPARAELARHKAIAIAARSAQQTAHQALVTAQAERDQAATAQLETAKDRLTRLIQWAPLAKALGLPVDPMQVDPPHLVAEFATAQQRVQALQQAEQVAATARQRLADGITEHHRFATALATTQESIRNAAARHAQTVSDATQAAVEVEGISAVFSTGLTAMSGRLGIPVPTDPAPWIDALGQHCESARAAAAAAATAQAECDRLADAWRLLLPSGGQLPTVEGGGTASLDSQVALARTSLAAGQRACQDADAARTAVAAMAAAVVVADQELATAEAALLSALSASPFPTEAAVLAALLLDPDRVALQERMAHCDQQQAIALAAAAEAAAEQTSSRQDLLARGLDPDDQGLGIQTTARLRTAEQGLALVHTESGAIRQRLAQDDANHDRRLAVAADQAALRQRRDRAARLKNLIGSADGSRFNRCAQALTLHQLLILANHHLRELAPRYQLRSEPQGEHSEPQLGIRVIDRDQADAERAITTLSGGETFLCSLALALALADLQRGRLRVGTLCIDEGFGSLDEHTLATAMAVLERLQQRQGTQILLISHVGALHERIAHRIEVVRRGGGVSRLRLVSPDGTSDEVPSLPALAGSDRADQRDRDQVLAALRDRGPLTRGEAQDLLGRDATAVRNLLKSLIAIGAVSTEGSGRGLRYRISTTDPGTTVDAGSASPDGVDAAEENMP